VATMPPPAARLRSAELASNGNRTVDEMGSSDGWVEPGEIPSELRNGRADHTALDRPAAVGDPTMRYYPARSAIWTGAAALIIATSISLGAQNEFTNNLSTFRPGRSAGLVGPAGNVFDLTRLPDRTGDAAPARRPPTTSARRPDRGQPTFFSRANRKVFTVSASDFGKKELPGRSPRTARRGRPTVTCGRTGRSA
jgi:hypothetical protein